MNNKYNYMKDFNKTTVIRVNGMNSFGGIFCIFKPFVIKNDIQRHNLA